MLQIFTTQLSGKMKTIKEKHEELLEDCSRIIAQTVVSGHTIYLHASGDLKSVIPQFLYGRDTFKNVSVIENAKDLPALEDQDSVILFSPSSHDEAALELANSLVAENKTCITIIGTTEKDLAEDGLHTLTDLSIELQASPMVPLDDGSRVGTPTALLALYVFHCLHLTTADILSEYE
ncbi:DUF2529 family protein [Alkalihalobacterium elongatum]|uniref:DUF2529 family protein n=1 Tax=Alkalihalobacterium elongatum TaxID=2675466 RepID=UPI001C1F85A1|nr:DUF2529 family protein [Alkalihalobacterium elongatum]